MKINKEAELKAYDRAVNDYLVHDKKIGDEISFISDKNVINIILTEEFESAVDILENSNKSAFITGKAGTGKSTLLKYFKSKTKKECVILSFTGLAAINVGGDTIHSFFKFPIGFIDAKNVRENKLISMLLRTVNTIVIDEVSMVRADLMDAIDTSLKKNRGNNSPFGGVQMIFIGDLYQLPPIIEKEMEKVYSRQYPSPFFFDAHIFNDHKIVKIDLQKIHRQTEPLFVEILNNLREKKHVWASAQILNRNVVDKTFLSSIQTSEYVVLCTTNAKTKLINDYYMSKLETIPHTYHATVNGLFDPASYPTDEALELKEGCKIIFIKNDTNMKTYVNGDVGIVKKLTSSSIHVETKRGMIDVDRGKWDKYKYDAKQVAIKDEDGNVEIKTVTTKVLVGSFEQYPIKLAWAISIHKSQGQTYDKVLIDFDKGCFTSGQAYVALSRCRTFDGIKLRRKMLESDVILDRRIHYIDKIIENGNTI
jgi:hypothetical protein